ncbi:MAG: hypothetical protein ACI9YL_000343 [Luteibaculaceae bacterium]|jgi:hypothetical protein
MNNSISKLITFCCIIAFGFACKKEEAKNANVLGPKLALLNPGSSQVTVFEGDTLAVSISIESVGSIRKIAAEYRFWDTLIIPIDLTKSPNTTDTNIAVPTTFMYYNHAFPALGDSGTVYSLVLDVLDGNGSEEVQIDITVSK